jgi:hypothetical protein
MLLVVGSRWDLWWWYGNHCVGDSSSFGDYVVYFVFRLIDSEVPLSLEVIGKAATGTVTTKRGKNRFPVFSIEFRNSVPKCGTTVLPLTDGND